MRLSDLPAVGLTIVRDAGFDALGLLSDDAPRMLVCLYDRRFLLRARRPSPHIACVLTAADLAASIPGPVGLAIADDPRRCFYAIHEYLRTATDFYGPDVESLVSPDARVHPRAWVSPRNVRIGPGAVIEAGALILERSSLGDEVVVGAGAVIGAEGFEPKEIGGALVAVRHTGGVRLHPRVEVQANSVVCRAVFGGETEIGEETKIAAGVVVSHNVRIGRRCRIAAGVGLSGSVRVGDDVWIGPNATISNLLRIGEGARVSLGSVVVRDVAPGVTVTGNFAIDHRTFLAQLRGGRGRG